MSSQDNLAPSAATLSSELNYATALQETGLSREDLDAVLISGVFDPDFYLKAYPDIAKAGINPLLHYLRHGRFEKRKASASLDPVAYLEANPSVANSEIEPFLHYVLIGRAAGAPRSLWDKVWRCELECSLTQSELEKLRVSDLIDRLRQVSEYTEVVRGLLDEINHVYSAINIRNPTTSEIAASITHFYRANPTKDERVAAVRQGEIRKHLGIRPLKLEMDIVNQCNLRCVMCHFSNPRNFTKKKYDIAVKDFERVASQIFSMCSHVSLSISTEPLLHRKIEQLLQITRSYKVPYVHMYTNAILLRRSIVEALIKEKVHALSISIDGATKQTYERIRVGARFDKLIANIQHLNETKRLVRSKTPHIYFNIVLMRSNIRELPTLVRLAHSLQVEAIYACHMVPLKAATVDPNESLQSDSDLCNRMLDEARKIAEEYGILVEFPDRFNAESSRQRPLFPTSKPRSRAEASCQLPWSFVGLLPDGSLIPCGWWYKEVPMGNIFKQTFEEIWNGDKYRKLRSEHLSYDAMRPVCQTCPTVETGKVDVNSSDAFAVR